MGVAGPMLTRLARWWLARRERPEPARPAILSGECICGKAVIGDDLHLVVALSDDDAALGIEAGGQTAMSADFCDEHCPGGCVRGCVASVP